ncbi:hypothetical protein [Lysobacter hankyongensis]|uniref:Histone H1 n=1 Tax=Lysobacter hankyongensis TaxID=1176535 RepID=A0ABP9AI99_9GAMM
MTTPKRPRDANQLAKLVLDIATGEEPEAMPEEAEPKLEAAVARGRKGGKARAKALTEEERAEIARKAAEARWGKKG